METLRYAAPEQFLGKLYVETGQSGQFDYTPDQATSTAWCQDQAQLDHRMVLRSPPLTPPATHSREDVKAYLTAALRLWKPATLQKLVWIAVDSTHSITLQLLPVCPVLLLLGSAAFEGLAVSTIAFSMAGQLSDDDVRLCMNRFGRTFHANGQRKVCERGAACRFSHDPEQFAQQLKKRMAKDGVVLEGQPQKELEDSAGGRRMQKRSRSPTMRSSIRCGSRSRSPDDRRRREEHDRRRRSRSRSRSRDRGHRESSLSDRRPVSDWPNERGAEEVVKYATPERFVAKLHVGSDRFEYTPDVQLTWCRDQKQLERRLTMVFHAGVPTPADCNAQTLEQYLRQVLALSSPRLRLMIDWVAIDPSRKYGTTVQLRPGVPNARIFLAATERHRQQLLTSVEMVACDLSDRIKFCRQHFQCLPDEHNRPMPCRYRSTCRFSHDPSEYRRALRRWIESGGPSRDQGTAELVPHPRRAAEVEPSAPVFGLPLLESRDRIHGLLSVSDEKFHETTSGAASTSDDLLRHRLVYTDDQTPSADELSTCAGRERDLRRVLALLRVHSALSKLAQWVARKWTWDGRPTNEILIQADTSASHFLSLIRPFNQGGRRPMLQWIEVEIARGNRLMAGAPVCLRHWRWRCLPDGTSISDCKRGDLCNHSHRQEDIARLLKAVQLEDSRQAPMETTDTAQAQEMEVQQQQQQQQQREEPCGQMMEVQQDNNNNHHHTDNASHAAHANLCPPVPSSHPAAYQSCQQPFQHPHQQQHYWPSSDLASTVVASPSTHAHSADGGVGGAAVLADIFAAPRAEESTLVDSLHPYRLCYPLGSVLVSSSVDRTDCSAVDQWPAYPLPVEVEAALMTSVPTGKLFHQQYRDEWVQTQALSLASRQSDAMACVVAFVQRGLLTAEMHLRMVLRAGPLDKFALRMLFATKVGRDLFEHTWRQRTAPPAISAPPVDLPPQIQEQAPAAQTHLQAHQPPPPPLPPSAYSPSVAAAGAYGSPSTALDAAVGYGGGTVGAPLGVVALFCVSCGARRASSDARFCGQCGHPH